MAASPSSPSWFTSLTCNPSSSIHQPHSFLQWLRFIFLSPCPQRLLFSAVDAVFLFLLLAFALNKLFSLLLQRRRGRGGGEPDSDAQKPLLSRSRVVLRTDLRFKLALAISSLLAAFFAVLLVLALTRLPRSQWQLAEAAFLLLQSLSHFAVAAIIAHEKRFRATTHPATLRVFWVASVLLTALLSASAVLRFVAAAPIFPDDPLSLSSPSPYPSSAPIFPDDNPSPTSSSPSSSPTRSASVKPPTRRPSASYGLPPCSSPPSSPPLASSASSPPPQSSPMTPSPSSPSPYPSPSSSSPSTTSPLPKNRWPGPTPTTGNQSSLRHRLTRLLLSHSKDRRPEWQNLYIRPLFTFNTMESRKFQIFHGAQPSHV